MSNITLQSNALPKRDRQAERVTRMAQVLQSFSSGFTLRPVHLNVVKDSGVPAWSSSDRIWIDETMLDDLTTAKGVASIKGLTLHEIAHILLTPRAGSDLGSWVQENSQYHTAFNALEDQRIESLLIASYPSIKDWFVATITHYLLSDAQSWVGAYPLVYGRKYLDQTIRSGMRSLYSNPENLAEIERIVGEYRTLNLANNSNTDKAIELIVAFKAVLDAQTALPDPHGHGQREDAVSETNLKSRPWNADKQDKAIDSLEKQDAETEQDDADETESASGTPSESADGAESEQDGSTQTPAQPEAEQTTKPSDAQNSAGAGGNEEALRDAVEKALEQSNTEVMERLEDKIQNDIDLYNGDVLLEGEVLPDPARSEHETTHAVSASAVRASEEFLFELQALRAKYEPSWLEYTDSGSINPVRWERGCELHEAYDRYEEGREDATDIEAVVLLDVSGSMRGLAVEAHESMWAIKNALDGINASTSVVAYSDGKDSALTLYSRDETVGSDMRYIGALWGTDPTKALQYAQGVLANSNRAIKLLIIITDGEWNGDCLERTEKSIVEMREGGVLTSLAWLESWDIDLNKRNLHGAEIVSHVRKPSDLFALARSIVDVGINRQLAR